MARQLLSRRGYMHASTRLVVTSVALALGLTALPGSALALKQRVHQQISTGECRRAGFGASFCDRVGERSYHVDAESWNDNIAHAQPFDGQSACGAADSVVIRLAGLGGQMRAAADAFRAAPSAARSDQMADALGRALHTVQDNCAHRGMANLQHAWLTWSASCRGRGADDPDGTTQARSCAAARSAELLSAAAAELGAMGIRPGGLTGASTNVNWPPRGGVCQWLRTANNWDGYDTRWNAERTYAPFRDGFVRGFRRQQRVSVCGGFSSYLAALPEARKNTAGAENFCPSFQAYCAFTGGNPLDLETPADEPTPWEEETDEDEDSGTAPEVTGGCAAGPAQASPVLALLLVGLLGRRRRGRGLPTVRR